MVLTRFSNRGPLRHERNIMRPLLPAIFVASAALLTGCIAVEDRSTKHDSPAESMDWSRVAATDGSRIVARGKPPLYFIYPGTGRLSVRDIDSNSILFSIEIPSSMSPEKTQISIGLDGKFQGKTANGVTDLGQVNRTHTYVITYLPADQLK